MSRQNPDPSLLIQPFRISSIELSSNKTTSLYCFIACWTQWQNHKVERKVTSFLHNIMTIWLNQNKTPNWMTETIQNIISHGHPKFNVLAKQRLKLGICCFNSFYPKFPKIRGLLFQLNLPQIPNPNRTKSLKLLPKIATQLIINHQIYSNSETGNSNLIKHENSYNSQK